jgi:hypothetical protein
MDRAAIRTTATTAPATTITTTPVSTANVTPVNAWGMSVSSNLSEGTIPSARAARVDPMADGAYPPEPEYGRQVDPCQLGGPMDTRAITIAALFTVIAIVVIVFVL